MNLSQKEKLHSRLGGWSLGIGFLIILGAAGNGDAPGTVPDASVLLLGGLIGYLLMGLGTWFLSDTLKWRRQDAANRRIESWFHTGYPIERWWA